MQMEIMKKGPIVGQMIVYQDFKKYTGRTIYQKRLGNVAGSGHAIKIIGWGVERGVPYWTIINSFRIK
jgi:cathepsin B